MTIALFLTPIALAGNIEVRVLSADGVPVPDIVVFIKSTATDARAVREPEPAVMDQRDISFVPHILVVESGAAVEFPNSDVVAHHVYSFSKPNNFVLPLYKGNTPSPVTLNHEGVVILGCNIHDGMLGYIVVVDTPVFGLTNTMGSISLPIDEGDDGYEVSIWSPRIRDSKEPLTQRISISDQNSVTFNLRKSLRRPHVDKSEAVRWDDY